MRLTFLRPTAQWATTAKCYNQPNRQGLQSDYNLGKYFTHETEKFSTLQNVATAFRSRENQIAIYGRPTPSLSIIGEEHARRTENFPYPDDQHLHCFDLDKWPVPGAV